MQLQYKLIISDFDGTLRKSSGGISQGNIDAIREYTRQGGIFALCTGRMLSSILPYAKELDLKGYVSAYQGAQIQDIQSGIFLRDQRIPKESAVAICSLLQQKNYHIHVYDGDVFYVNKDDSFRKLYEKICGVTGILSEDIVEKVKENNIAPHKILVACEEYERNAILNDLTEKFGQDFYVTTSTVNLVEIVSKNCDKGDALEYIAKAYGIKLSDTIAIGDNFNDLPMIKRAGLGVAVAGAEEALKKEAGFVTKGCDEDGVGYVIEKFGLGKNV